MELVAVVQVVVAIHVQAAVEIALGLVTILVRADAQIVAMPLAVIIVREQTHNGIHN